MTDDPLLPYLIEIISQPEAKGIILAGGFGMRVKQNYLRKLREMTGSPITLIDGIPETRATQDIDLLLSVGLWIDAERARALSSMLKTRLNYETVIHGWHLKKPMANQEGRFAKLDLLARSPLADEPVKVKDRPRQVGREMGTGISARETPEAFAIDDTPLLLTVSHVGSEHSVLVPHPYPWFNLKVRAAYDWLREMRGDPDVEPKLTADNERIRTKHVYDVYVLTAMLTERELAESSALAARYIDHEEAKKTQEQAEELFGKKSADGISMIEAYSSRYLGSKLNVDHELFWDGGLKTALGI